jgi:hypothetical protein
VRQRPIRQSPHVGKQKTYRPHLLLEGELVPVLLTLHHAVERNLADMFSNFSLLDLEDEGL